MPADILIFGGGIIGVCSAYYLKLLKPELKITIIDGSEEVDDADESEPELQHKIAAGATGKAGGLLALDWHGAATESLAELSFKEHLRLAKEFDGKTNYGFRELDTISVSANATKPAFNQPRPKVPIPSWMNQELSISTRTLGTTNSTAQVHPLQFTNFLFEKAQSMGVEFILGSVDSISRLQNGEEGYSVEISTTDGSIKLETKKILVAAGPWSGSLLTKLGICSDTGRARNIDGERAHSVVLRTACELPAQAWFTSIKMKNFETHEPEIYNRPDGTSYCCGTTDSSPLPPKASDVKHDPSAIKEILNQVATLSKHLQRGGENGATVELMQACYLPTGTTTPILDNLGDGLFVASGHSCWGITLGPGTGKVMAEMILGQELSADVTALKN